MLVSAELDQALNTYFKHFKIRARQAGDARPLAPESANVFATLQERHLIRTEGGTVRSAAQATAPETDAGDPTRVAGGASP